ncbi:hypothetical protein HBI60_252390 [Parastagonospora nodorum]|nr:hypothetical protein HBI60_252390 [Parastagonospora nodorum]
MVRPVTNEDIGLRVLREAPAEAAQRIDIVAIHGLGAHPDDSWCTNAGTRESPRWVNWLEEESMLPAVVPNARIMRYGYQSQWFGQEMMQQSVSTVAERLLRALKRTRKDVAFRPLMFVAHCFGGLVVLKTLLEAEQYQNDWPGVFSSTTGLIFFGTPFRGAEGMNQMEMLEAARREYHEDQVQPTALEVLQPGNAYLREVVDGYLKRTRGQTNKTQIACFYEQKSSNVGKIVGKEDRTRFVVSESSGCLDVSDATSKYSLSRTHFDMNKFAKASEEDFETVADVVKDMAEGSPALLSARSQYNGKHKIELSLQGVPVVNQFVNRPTEMTAVEDVLLEASPATLSTTKRRRKVVVVFGLGGIGKTQLAVEFARKHHHRFSAVFWLDGSSEASLKQSFVDMAQRLPRSELTAEGAAQLSDATVEADVAVRECQQWLSIQSNPHWLLLIDNVDRDHRDRDDLQAYNVQAYFPHADHGSILVTSRLSSLQRLLGSGVKVGTVAAEQARAILENNASRVVEDAEVVLELLHGLPLALTQAGSYMRETNASASAYAKHYSRTWERLMKSEARFPLEEYGDRSVLTTWTISYGQVQRQSKEAAWLLKLWGFLDSGEVWYELIAAGSRLAASMSVPAWLLSVAEDELTYGDAMGLLSRHSLAEGREDTDSHSMHSVLHRWCGYLAEDKERQELGYLAARLVASIVPLKSDAEFSKKRKRLMAHGIRVSIWIEEGSGSDKERVIKALIMPGYLHSLGYLFQDNDRQRAVQMYQRALQGYEKAWGPEHTSTLNTVNNLGVLYKNLGRLDEAEKMYQRALQGKEKAWGPEHTSTLDTVNNLGLLYADLGRLDEAEKMYQQALQGYEKAWGPEHTETLVTVNNLGLLYADLGRLDEAEKMYQQALQGYEKAWGPEHTSTLDTVNNLAGLYMNLGRLDKAEKMYQRALQGFEKAWGPEHTSTLDTVNNLGNLYADLGRLDEAEKMYQRALQGYEKAWGPEHTSTLDTVNNLAGLHMNLGRLDEAEKMYQRALQGKEKAWGPEHTSTLNTVNNLGVLYADLGRLDEAEKMYQQALQGYEKAWGPEHTSTLNTVNNLGVLYKNLGRLDEAEKMYQRALQGKEKAWGPEHTSTLDTVNNLGLLYADLGRLDEAEKMYQQALQGYEKAWGPEHTETLVTVNNLGLLYADLGRLEEAEKMYQRALDGYAKAISPKDLMTYVPALRNMWAFASLRESQGCADDARHWYSQTLVGYEKTFGPDYAKCESLRASLALLRTTPLEKLSLSLLHIRLSNLPTGTD